VHALGDRAVRDSLDAVEHARAVNGALGHRHHLAHVQVVDPVDVPRFAELASSSTRSRSGPAAIKPWTC